ncbi:MAG: Ppx/GppA family phosphatase [Acidimicrobiales bacterium]|nr:Ppx/GppA family phosphatase [Acidimicrobiales bacterium]MYD82230.1 Ppx/GppA family phosphatase [Acidimicrobiales bacterium]MYJ64674.1 Ppx/GppA family phosphatase [Acidimicrobiales bacterium]
MSVIAAIDVGTNSFHLVVASVDADGHFEVLTREREPVRLGSGGEDMKRLTADAMDRGIAALDRMRRIADHAGAAAVTAVATSAVREADNRGEFVARARVEAGVDIQVVSGIEEARLIHLGVMAAVPLLDKRHLVIDIGGGSTEFIVGDGAEPLLMRSLKLGSIRLTDRFFPEGRSRKRAVRECCIHIESFLGHLPAEIGELGFETAVGSSGTIMALARMCAIRRGDRDSRTGRLSFTAKELRSLTADLANAMTPARRLDIDGLEERRADIIVGGALLLSETFKLLGIKRMEVSDYALREGILLEQMRRAAAPGLDPFHRLEDLRRSGVMYVANSYHEDLGHAEHITDLALELFDGLSTLHGLGEEDRELFEAASLLHNVGIFISHSAHHRHSYYIIRNSEHLTGFTEREIEIIAQVARYHRKSAPKSKHPEFASLGSADKNKVRWMAAMLRVAIGLDRSNRQVVTRIRVAHEPGESDRLLSNELRLVARVSPGVDTSVELFTARARSELLESVTGRVVVIEPEVAVTGKPVHPTNGTFSGDPSRLRKPAPHTA